MLTAQAAQQYAPKDRQRFMEYVQSDPVAAAQIRAPLYEDKVVDFLFDKAEVTDRASNREELEAAIEAEDDGSPVPHVHGPDCGHDHHDHDHDHAPKPKKASAKKAAEAPAEEAVPAPAKKPAAVDPDAIRLTPWPSWPRSSLPVPRRQAPLQQPQRRSLQQGPPSQEPRRKPLHLHR